MENAEYKKLQSNYINKERARYIALLNGTDHVELGLHNLSGQRIKERLIQLDEMEIALRDH
jgi:hypothetical protein